MLDLSPALILFAQEAAPEPAAGQPPGLLLGLMYLVPIVVLFYFMLLRPNQKRERDRKTMLAAIKKNDHVVTVGGIKGVVTHVKPEEDEVVLKVDDATGAKLRVVLSSIARVIAADEPAAAASKDT